MRRISYLALVCFFALSLPAAAPGAEGAVRMRRPKSHRWREADRQSRQRRAEAEHAAQRGKKKKTGRLEPGRWRPEVADELERVLDEYGAGTPEYDPGDPPVALFDWDDVSITHHVGDALFYHLVTEAAFKFSDEFWDRVPVHFGRLRIRAGYNEFHELPPSVWPQNSYYRIYRKEFFRCYQAVCREYGRSRCALWRTKLLAGFSEDELRDYLGTVLDKELKRPVGVEKIGTTIEDPDPVTVRVGLRWIPEMRDLYAKLREQGFDIWVVSSANQWAVEEMAQAYGVYPSRVAGIRLKNVDGVMTDENLLPVPVGGGQREAIVMFIGRSPRLIIGGEDGDAMLGYGRGARIRIVDSAEALPGFARLRGRSDQPRFSPVRMPQTR
ncbi:MAG: hypothetical protein ABIJ96_02160 [Elusimicrobiota bacterium]